MRRRIAALLLTIAMAGVTRAQSSGAPVQGPGAESRDPEWSCYQVRDEGQALLSAPHGAERISEHVLAVTYKTGVRRFVDKKPYREELSGFHWQYCGYIPALKAHLVGFEQDDLFSGKLLLDDSGGLLSAGHTVQPSPHGKLFLADSQQNGEYLGDWTISNLAGKVLWAGKGGVEQDGQILVEYDETRWISDNELKAVAICNDQARSRGEAVFTADGRSGRWRSDLRCNP